MIGIFDSGMGGLTVLDALKQQMPQAEVVYFGDTKNAPYGNRTREELGALTVLGLKRLIDAGASNIIAACNSVSVGVAEPLLAIAGMERKDVIEMVGPTARALSQRAPMRILVVATRATIESGMYQSRLSESGHEVIGLAIPALAGAIEANADSAPIIEVAFAKLQVPPDVMLFGCTHFPLVRHVFDNAITQKSWKVEYVDPAVYVAAEARVRFGGSEEGNGSIRFLLSNDSKTFRQNAESLFSPFPYTIDIV